MRETIAALLPYSSVSCTCPCSPGYPGVRHRLPTPRSLHWFQVAFGHPTQFPADLRDLSPLFLSHKLALEIHLEAERTLNLFATVYALAG